MLPQEVDETKIIEEIKTNPTFAASILCSSITNLERSGLDSNLLKNEEIMKSFQLLEAGKIAKESIEIVFENIMAGTRRSPLQLARPDLSGHKRPARKILSAFSAKQSACCRRATYVRCQPSLIGLY